MNNHDRIYRAPDANTVWLNLIRRLISHGEPVSPRGLLCHEILGCSSTVDMHYPCVTVAARKLSHAFMANEAEWILAGDDRVKTIVTHAPSIAQFSDDGTVFFGAYGPKVVAQLYYIVETLFKDRDTRQAVLNIWRDNPPQTKDVPCTTTVQWFIRNNRLHCFDTMRSSDAWLGWPYDIFNFSMLSAVIVLCLKKKGLALDLGSITLTAASQHLYAKNRGGANDCIQKTFSLDYRPLNVNEFAEAKELTDHLRSLHSGLPTGHMFMKELF